MTRAAPAPRALGNERVCVCAVVKEKCMCNGARRTHREVMSAVARHGL